MKNYIVFDLEWNQSSSGRETFSPRLSFEIFEIGAVKLNEKFEKVSEFHRLIKPCVYRQMHHIISEVTHVSMEELERRLRGRGDTNEEQIALRTARAQWEMEQSKKYDHIVINDQVEACVDAILNIIAQVAD